MSIKVGDRLPSVTLTTMTDEGPKPLAISELCEGKKVVLFAVPGAFTPTCSVQHLPGFVDNNQSLKDKGVDSIVCISVNDPFVMGAWGKDREVGEDVLMLSDGNGEFTAAIGLEMDGSGFGLGTRWIGWGGCLDPWWVRPHNLGLCECGPTGPHSLCSLV